MPIPIIGGPVDPLSEWIDTRQSERYGCIAGVALFGIPLPEETFNKLRRGFYDRQTDWLPTTTKLENKLTSVVYVIVAVSNPELFGWKRDVEEVQHAQEVLQ